MRIWLYTGLIGIVSAWAFAADEGGVAAKDGLEAILPKWQAAWNDSDVKGLMALYHADSEMRRLYDAGGKSSERVKQGFSGIIKEFGAITDFSIGSYIERKGIRVAKITYAEKGLVPGTFRLKKDDAGKWLIDDFNIDGQSEPELRE